MRTQFLDVICFVVLCVILTLGLWPFHSPRNEVAWLGNHYGLRFGQFSTVISSTAFPMTRAEEETFGSVEIWLQPRRIWDKGTLLAFSTPGNPPQFSLHQSEVDLELQTGANKIRLYVDNVFCKPGPVFVTITSGKHGTAVYTDGVLVKMAPQFRLPANGFTGQLVLGDSPGQTDSWSGQLLSLAVFCVPQKAAPVSNENAAPWPG